MEQKTFVDAVYREILNLKNVLVKIPATNSRNLNFVPSCKIISRDPQDPEKKGVIVEIQDHLNFNEFIEGAFVSRNYFINGTKVPYGKFIVADVSIKNKEDWYRSSNNLKESIVIDIFLTKRRNPEWKLRLGTPKEGQVRIPNTEKFILFEKMG